MDNIRYKIQVILLTVVLSVCGVTNVFSQEITVDGINYQLDPKDRTAEVLRNVPGGYAGDIIIPETVSYEDDDYTVTSLGYQCFYECWDITSITLPNSIKSLRNECFYKCI